MCCFIVGLPLDAGLSEVLKAFVAIWHNDSDHVNAWGLIVEFRRPFMVISILGSRCGHNFDECCVLRFSLNLL